MYTLKLASLVSWGILLLFQVSLLWPDYQIDVYWALLAIFPLLTPITGLWREQRYTYKWIGFLTLPYFCVGISELVANPALALYGLGTTVASTVLFLSTMYYARFLGIRERQQN